jgi:hypothetical protein
MRGGVPQTSGSVLVLFSFASDVCAAVACPSSRPEAVKRKEMNLFLIHALLQQRHRFGDMTMDRMTFYAAGALMAWVLVGAAAIL